MKKIVFTLLTLIILSCSTKNNNDMGLFDKIFGKKETSQPQENFAMNSDSSQIAKTAEMLDEELFWSIVEKSLKNTTNQANQEKYLITEIGKLTPLQIIGFRLRTDKLLFDTYNSEMWCAGYIMNGGCSDDGFEYFRNWVISRGKDVYYIAKQNPDGLIDEVDGNLEFYDFEGFWYVALVAFNKKTGKELYDFIDFDNFKASEGSYPQFEFTWQEENPESMRKICPKLFEKFWNKY